MALSVPLIIESGPWTIQDTLLALVVGVVLVAYYERFAARTADWKHAAAFAVVLVAIGVVFLSFPAQYVSDAGCRETLRPGGLCSDVDADIASLWALGLSAVATIGWWLVRRRWLRGTAVTKASTAATETAT